MVDITQHEPSKSASIGLEVNVPQRSAVYIFCKNVQNVKTAGLAIAFQAGLQVLFGSVLNLVFRWLLTASEGERLPGALFLAGYVGTAYSLLVTYISVTNFRFLYLLGACSLMWSSLFLGSQDWLWALLGTGVAVLSVVLLVPLQPEKNSSDLPSRPG